MKLLPCAVCKETTPVDRSRFWQLPDPRSTIQHYPSDKKKGVSQSTPCMLKLQSNMRARYGQRVMWNATLSNIFNPQHQLCTQHADCSWMKRIWNGAAVEALRFYNEPPSLCCILNQTQTCYCGRGKRLTGDAIWDSQSKLNSST